MYLDLLKESGVTVQYGASVDTVRKEGAKITVFMPSETMVIPQTVAVIAGAQNRGEAEELTDYLLGGEVEKSLAEGKAGSSAKKMPCLMWMVQVRPSAEIVGIPKATPGTMR